MTIKLKEITSTPTTMNSKNMQKHCLVYTFVCNSSAVFVSSWHIHFTINAKYKAIYTQNKYSGIYKCNADEHTTSVQAHQMRSEKCNTIPPNLYIREKKKT